MSDLIHIDCEQNSPEWFAARLGIPTASMFATILAKGKDGGISKTRTTYLYKLAGEILTGQQAENYSNHHMERGHAMEAEARAFYEFQKDVECTRVGFFRRGEVGASPDSVVGELGLLEIKTKLPHLLIEDMLANKFPAEHVIQCQGQLWVTQLAWLDIAIYWPKLPLFVKRIEPDLKMHARLDEETQKFNYELFKIVERLRQR